MNQNQKKINWIVVLVFAFILTSFTPQNSYFALISNGFLFGIGFASARLYLDKLIGKKQSKSALLYEGTLLVFFMLLISIKPDNFFNDIIEILGFALGHIWTIILFTEDDEEKRKRIPKILSELIKGF